MTTRSSILQAGSRQRPVLLVVEDDQVLNQLLVHQLIKAGYEVDSAYTWAQAQAKLGPLAPDLVLLDLHLPDSSGLAPLTELATNWPVVMLTAYGSVHQAVEAMHLGAADYLIKPVNLDELELCIRRALDSTRLATQKEWMAGSRAAGRSGDAMIGESAPMQRLRQLVRDVAQADVTVLIQGESGSGKELVAQALHQYSQRQGEAFVPIDCCTLQETLFESELFGHEKGSFTGADRRKTGLIEAAARGTLFLDEIGEAGPPIQAKLLRFIETGRFRRVGSTLDLRADARVVAATNRDLRALSTQGSFRADLYYRLSTFVIEVPPLREREGDVALLADHFLQRRSQSRGVRRKHLSSSAMARLDRYDWPGNVRELRNVIERAFIMAGAAECIESEHLSLPDTVKPVVAATRPAAGNWLEQEPTLESIEREYLIRLLDKYHGNRRRVAEVLGVSERTAYRMLERHGLKATEGLADGPA
jgi:DNA-binding NtrC family response regulator